MYVWSIWLFARSSSQHILYEIWTPEAIMNMKLMRNERDIIKHTFLIVSSCCSERCQESLNTRLVFDEQKLFRFFFLDLGSHNDVLFLLVKLFSLLGFIYVSSMKLQQNTSKGRQSVINVHSILNHKSKTIRTRFMFCLSEWCLMNVDFTQF